MKDPVYLVGAARTAIGSFQGSLADAPAPTLGASVIQAALTRAGLYPSPPDEVLMGCVLSAGIGQAPARQAALAAGLSTATGTATINKVCGSGLYAAMLAASRIRAGDSDVIVAGGMESMSRAPYYLLNARKGLRMGHQTLTDGMILDGLWDPYNDFHMGAAGELCAERYAFSREAQDAFAHQSYERARAASASGAFRSEITPVSVAQRKGEPLIVDTDEEPARADLDRLAALKPAFNAKGAITAGNASTLNDGAAAVVVASARATRERQLKPLAKIRADVTFSHDPQWFTTAPIGAITSVAEKAGVSLRDIDLFEINEAFAVVPMAAIEELSLPPERVNVNGGAIALGHPIGASGARLLVTLLYALAARDKTLGLVTLCIGGGESVAMVVERL
ncbi:MAG: acetyl-CoA C-acyltransferase [Vampirovibrionales bacterium]|nr:acetyl-CoA C-acyltransferase [Vampirovibrionales bacterium]